MRMLNLAVAADVVDTMPPIEGVSDVGLSSLPRIRAIFTASIAGAPMVRKVFVQARAGVGLVGDRYAEARGTWSKAERQVTLIGYESIKAGNKKLFDAGLKPFLWGETRRNIVIDGRAEDLIGKEFWAGDVRMHGVGPADPCNRPGLLCVPQKKPGFKEHFKGLAGIWAEILSDGIVRAGDPIDDIVWRAH